MVATVAVRALGQVPSIPSLRVPHFGVPCARMAVIRHENGVLTATRAHQIGALDF